ncbi:MAG: InlB B-repeat-containing protein [Clostridia bacterium]|nr:InlB B-repeat-containing protein [Clostridia bacterium]
MIKAFKHFVWSFGVMGIMLACLLGSVLIANGKQVNNALADGEQTIINSAYWENYAEMSSGITFTAAGPFASSSPYGTITLSSDPEQAANNLAWIAVQVNSHIVDGGAGSAEDWLSSKEGKYKFSVKISGGDYYFYNGFYGTTIELKCNIDLSSKLWVPIGLSVGNDSASFKGIFKGNGHKISGVRFDSTQSYPDRNRALFGSIWSGAVISDLTITDCSGVSGYLVGDRWGNGGIIAQCASVGGKLVGYQGDDAFDDANYGNDYKFVGCNSNGNKLNNYIETGDDAQNYKTFGEEFVGTNNSYYAVYSKNGGDLTGITDGWFSDIPTTAVFSAPSGEYISNIYAQAYEWEPTWAGKLEDLTFDNFYANSTSGAMIWEYLESSVSPETFTWNSSQKTYYKYLVLSKLQGSTYEKRVSLNSGSNPTTSGGNCVLNINYSHQIAIRFLVETKPLPRTATVNVYYYTGSSPSSVYNGNVSTSTIGFVSGNSYSYWNVWKDNLKFCDDKGNELTPSSGGKISISQSTKTLKVQLKSASAAYFISGYSFTSGSSAKPWLSSGTASWNSIDITGTTDVAVNLFIRNINLISMKYSKAEINSAGIVSTSTDAYGYLIRKISSEDSDTFYSSCTNNTGGAAVPYWSDSDTKSVTSGSLANRGVYKTQGSLKAFVGSNLIKNSTTGEPYSTIYFGWVLNSITATITNNDEDDIDCKVIEYDPYNRTYSDASNSTTWYKTFEYTILNNKDAIKNNVNKTLEITMWNYYLTSDSDKPYYKHTLYGHARATGEWDKYNRTMDRSNFNNVILFYKEINGTTYISKQAMTFVVSNRFTANNEYTFKLSIADTQVKFLGIKWYDGSGIEFTDEEKERYRYFYQDAWGLGYYNDENKVEGNLIKVLTPLTNFVLWATFNTSRYGYGVQIDRIEFESSGLNSQINISTSDKIKWSSDDSTQEYAFTVSSLQYDGAEYYIQAYLSEYSNKIKTIICYADGSEVNTDVCAITKDGSLPGTYIVPDANGDAVFMPKVSENTSGYYYKYSVEYHSISSIGIYYNNEEVSDDFYGFINQDDGYGGVSFGSDMTLPGKTDAYILKIVVEKKNYTLNISSNGNGSPRNVSGVSFNYEDSLKLVIEDDKTGWSLYKNDQTTPIAYDKTAPGYVFDNIMFNGVNRIDNASVTINAIDLISAGNLNLTATIKENSPTSYGYGRVVKVPQNGYFQTPSSSNNWGTSDYNTTKYGYGTNGSFVSVDYTTGKITFNASDDAVNSLIGSSMFNLSNVNFLGYELVNNSWNRETTLYNGVVDINETFTSISNFENRYVIEASGSRRVYFVPVFEPINYSVEIQGKNGSITADLYYNNLDNSGYVYNHLNTLSDDNYTIRCLLDGAYSWDGTLGSFESLLNNIQTNGIITNGTQGTINSLIYFMTNNMTKVDNKYSFKVGYSGKPIWLKILLSGSCIADGTLPVKYGYGAYVGSTAASGNVFDWSSTFSLEPDGNGLGSVLDELYLDNGLLVHNVVFCKPDGSAVSGYDSIVQLESITKSGDQYVVNYSDYAVWEAEDLNFNKNGYNSTSCYINLFAENAAQNVTFDGTFLDDGDVEARVVNFTDIYLEGYIDSVSTSLSGTVLSFEGNYPTREGHTFKYWKDSTGNYKIYLNADGTIGSTTTENGKGVEKPITTIVVDEDLYFYAYWEADEISISNNNVSKTYDTFDFGGTEQGVLIATITIYDTDSIFVNPKHVGASGYDYLLNSSLAIKKDVIGVYKKGSGDISTDVHISKDALRFQYVGKNDELYIYALGLKYVADSGEFYVVFNYLFDTDNSNEAYNANYITNSGSLTQTNNRGQASAITINKRLIEMNSDVIKEYDGDANVLQSVKEINEKTSYSNSDYGILGNDKNIFSVSAEYNDKNAGTEKQISCSFVKKSGTTDDLYNKTIGSYDFAQMTGEITPCEIEISFNDVKVYYETSIADTSIESGCVLCVETGAGSTSESYFINGNKNYYSGIIYSDSYYKIGGIVNNIESSSMIRLEFNLVAGTIASESNIFDLSNKNLSAPGIVVVNNITIEGDLVGNYKFVAVKGGSITFTQVAPNKRVIEVVVKEEKIGGFKDTTNATITLQTIEPTVSRGNSLQFIGDKIAFPFSIKLDITNSDYWFKQVIGGSCSEPAGIFASKILEITIPIDSNSVEIIITNYSTVTYEFGLFDGESASGIELNAQGQYISTIKFGDSITLLDASNTRAGLTFDGWYYHSGSNLVKYTNTTWNLKGDVVLYAMWNFVAQISKCNDISATYDPSITYEFGVGADSDYEYAMSGEGASINPNYLSYRWEKSVNNGATWYFAGSNKTLSVRQVSDSAEYKLVVSISRTYTIGGIDYNVISSTITEPSVLTVSISKKDVVLSGTINLVYDTGETYSIEITNDMVLELSSSYKQELVGETATWTLTGNAGIYNNQVLSFANGNYVLYAANINVQKRDITISFKNSAKDNVLSNGVITSASQSDTTVTVVYTGYSIKVEDDASFNISESDSKYKFYGISVETNNSDVATYNQTNANLNTTLYVSVAGKSISVNNFNITWNAVIIIDYAELQDENIIFTNTKTYNMNSQTIDDIKVFGNLLSGSQYSILYNGGSNNGENYVGRTNSGSDSVKLVINYPNYSQKTIITSFTILKLAVEITQSGMYQKVYDGTVSASPAYAVSFETPAGGVAASLEADVRANGEISFTFADKHAEVGKTLLKQAKQNGNFAITFVGSFVGTINKKDATLDIYYEQVPGVYATKYYVLYTNSQVLISYDKFILNGIVDDDELSGGDICFNYINVGEYTLANEDLVSNDIVIGSDIITKNYNITGYLGKVVINKAKLEFSLNRSTTYTSDYLGNKILSGISVGIFGKDYNTDKNYEGADIFEMLEIAIKKGNSIVNPINAGEYLISITLKATFTSNYELLVSNPNLDTLNGNTLSYTFTVNPAPLNITISKSKNFDGTVLGINFVNYNDMLIAYAKDSFTSGSATTCAVNARTYIYNSNSLDNTINLVAPAIINSLTNASAFDNYEITYNITLTINANSPEGFVILTTGHDYTYTGSAQNIYITIGETNYIIAPNESATPSGENDEGQVIQLDNNSKYADENVSVVLTSSGGLGVTYEGVAFKYVRPYTLTVTSASFGTYVLEPVMNAKRISAESITVDTSLKIYDGNTNLASGTIISSSDVAANDASHLKLSGAYDNPNVGARKINVIIDKDNITSCQEGTSIRFVNYLKASYEMADNVQVDGEILQRTVTFTLNNSSTRYYTGQYLILDVSDFNISGAVLGETFVGSLLFESIIDANTYDLSAVSTDADPIEDEIIKAKITKNLTCNPLKENYAFAFVGEITISKAEIRITDLKNRIKEYNGEAQTVDGYTIDIYQSHGELVGDVGLELEYRLQGTSDLWQVYAGPNVGTYDIQYKLSGANKNNYKLADLSYGENITTFKILQKNVEVKVIRNELYDEIFATTGYTFTLQGANLITLVGGHVVEGTVTIPANKYESKTFFYSDSLEEYTEGVYIDLTIKDAISNVVATVVNNEANVNNNYLFTYNIKLTFSGEGVGAVATLATDSYYNALDQKSTIPVAIMYRVSANGELFKRDGNNALKLDATNYEYNDTVNGVCFTLDGFVTDPTDPIGTSVSIVKNVGTYYAKIHVVITGTVDFTVDGGNNGYIYAEVNILQHEISISNLYNGLNKFNGTKDYDGSSELNLTVGDSDSVVATDNLSNGANILVKATFYEGTTPSASAGSKIVKFEILNNSYGNYVLSSSQIDGQINGIIVTITGLQSDYTKYPYMGSTTHNLPANKLITDGLLTGFSLTGNVVVSVGDAGEYLLNDANISNISGLIVKDTNNVDVPNGCFIFEFANNVKYEVEKAQIEISYTGNLEYIGLDQTDTVKQNILVSGVGNNSTNQYLVGAGAFDVALELKYSFVPNELGVSNASNLVVFNAGTYTLIAPVATTNYEYSISATNNSFMVGKRSIEIDLGNDNTAGYKYYLAHNNMFKLTNTMSLDVFDVDIYDFTQIVFKLNMLNENIVAGIKYSYADGYIDILIGSKSSINNNYQISSASGSIEILEENIQAVQKDNLIYDGTDQLQGLVLEYKLDGEPYAITINYNLGTYSVSLESGNTDNVSVVSVSGTNANNQAISNEIIDAGAYVVVVKINSINYNYNIIVEPKKITSENIYFTDNKEYDGTNTVYYEDNGIQNISFKDGVIEPRDTVLISATYSDYRVNSLAEPLNIIFAISGAGAFNYNLVSSGNIGNITAKALTIDFDSNTKYYSKDGLYSLDYVSQVGLIYSDDGNENNDDVIVVGTVVFNLGALNKIGTYNISLDAITKSGLVIKRGMVDVTTCYDITYTGSLTIQKRQIELSIGLKDGITDISWDSVNSKYVSTFKNGDYKDSFKYTITNTANLEGVDFTSNIKLSINDQISAGAKDVGTYSLAAVLDSIYTTNYELSFTAKTFQIVKYTYTLTNDDYDSISFQKEYGAVDPALSKIFEATTNMASSYEFVVEFTRSAGEGVGDYDLISATTGDANINLISDLTKLQDKFHIIQNNQTLAIKITAIKDGATAPAYTEITGNTISRKYGHIANDYSIDLFEYDIYVAGSKITDNDLIAYLKSTISGNVPFGIEQEIAGETLYDIRELSQELTTLTSIAYKYVTLETAETVKLRIDKRPISIVIENSDKTRVYDGTDIYYNDYSVNYNVTNYGSNSGNDAHVYIEYNSANVLDADRLLFTLLSDGSSVNYEIQTEYVLASITTLAVSVAINDNSDDDELDNILKYTYGESIVIDYSVSANTATILTTEQLKQEVVVSAIGADANLSNALKTIVGDYAVSAVSNGNVNITNSINKTVRIVEKELVVIPNERIIKTQDSTKDIDVSNYSFTFDGLILGDQVSVESATFGAYVGDNLVITFTLLGADSSNYIALNGEGDIKQRLISIVLHYNNFEGCGIPNTETIVINDVPITASTTTISGFDYYKSLDDNMVKLPGNPEHQYDGYTFKNWKYENNDILNHATSLNEQFILGDSDDELHIYADWEINTYKVTILVLYEELETGHLESIQNQQMYVVNPYTLLEYNQTIIYDESTYTFTIGNVEQALSQSDIANLQNQHLEFYQYLDLDGYYKKLTNDFVISGQYVFDEVERSITLAYVYKLDEVTVVFSAGAGQFVQSEEYAFVSTVDGVINKVEYTEEGLVFTLKYGQNLAVFDTLSNTTDLATYLSNLDAVSRIGYTFQGWGSNVSDILSAIVYSDVNNEYLAVFENNQYTLTLDAESGIFSLEETDIVAGWTYTDGSHKTIQNTVVFDMPIPLLPQPTWVGYEFDKYSAKVGEDEYIPSPISNLTNWTIDSDLVLYAEYIDIKQYIKIEVTNEHATFDVSIKNNLGGSVYFGKNLTETDEIEVYTSYSISINVKLGAGYHVDEFDYTISDFIEPQQNLTLGTFTASGFASGKDNIIQFSITTAPNQNTITLLDDEHGYMLVDFGGMVYDSRDITKNQILIYTGQTFTINTYANDGYEFDTFVINADGTGEISELNVYSEFTSNSTITACFKAKNNVVSIVLSNDAGLDNVGGYMSEVDLDSVATDTTIVIYFEKPNHFDTFQFVDVYKIESAEPEDIYTSLIDKVNVIIDEISDDTFYIVTITGFTSDFTIEFKYIANTYDVTITYYEWDEVSQTASKITALDAGNQYNATILYVFNAEDISITLENVIEDTNIVSVKYNDSLQVIADFEKYGYTLYEKGYSFLYYDLQHILQEYYYSNDTLFQIDKDCEIRIVLERKKYTYEYSVDGNGLLQDGLGNQMSGVSGIVRFGRIVPGLTAVAKEYYELEGWYKDGEKLDDGLTNLALTATKDYDSANNEKMLLVAKFIGQQNEITFRFEGVSGYVISNNLIDFATITVAGQNTQVEPIKVTQDGSIVEITITYRTGDSINMLFNPENCYKYGENERVDNNFSYSIASLMPYTFGDAGVVIRLELIKYNITFTSQTAGAFKINNTTNNAVEVTHGDELLVYVYVTEGYYFDIAESDLNGFTVGYSYDEYENKVYGYYYEQNNTICYELTLDKALEDKTITLVFAKQYFKITFNTDHPDGEGNEVVQFYYVEYGTSDIFADSLLTTKISATDLSRINLISYTDVNGIVYSFNGWSPYQDSKRINKRYYIGEEGIIYFPNEVINGAFNGIGVASRDRAISIDLYGTWYLELYEIRFEVATSGIISGIEELDLFNGVIIPTLVISGGKFMAPQGTVFENLNLPTKQGFTYYGYSVDSPDGIIFTGPFRFVMDKNNTVIYLHYSFITSVTISVDGNDNGNNTAYIVSDSEHVTSIEILQGTFVTFEARADDGYEFVRWEITGSNYEEFYSNTSADLKESTLYLQVNQSILVTAVFAAKSVNVAIVDGGDVTSGAISFNEGTLSKQITARVGDVIYVYYDPSKITYGYELTALRAGDNTLYGYTRNDGIWVCAYRILEEDGEVGYVEIKPFANVLSLEIEFVVNDTNAGKILESERDITGNTAKYIYNTQISIDSIINARYGFVKLIINGTEYNTTSMIIDLNQGNGFRVDGDGEINKIELVLKANYWYEIEEEYAGTGTESSPFLIGNAKQLAYMASMINSGKLNQEERRYYFRITDNINLDDRFWKPIGTKDFPFDGIFELGQFKITNTHFEVGNEPEFLDEEWGKYCYGVFGYVTDRAEIIIDKSILPAIIIFGSIGVAGVAGGIVVFAIIAKRKKKYKKLSGNLNSRNIESKEVSQSDIDSIEEVNIGSGEEVGGVGELVRQTNNEADEKLISSMVKQPPARPNVAVPTRPNIQDASSIKAPLQPPIKPNPVPPAKPMTQPNIPQKPGLANSGGNSGINKPPIRPNV